MGLGEELFSKKVQVALRSHDREDRRAALTIKIELQLSTSPVSRKELVVRLTDDSDLFFLYTLRLNEEDFQNLKTQQGLLVDYGAFPQKLIDLIEMCLKEEHREIPKFILQFSSSSLGGERSTGTLNIVETNPFKHLVHLSLKFIPGNDADVKKYLASCLQQYKDTNQLLQQRLEHIDSDLNHRLKQSQESLTLKSVELDSLKAEWTARMKEIEAHHKEQMSSEKERAVQFQSSSHQKQDREKRELEQAHMKIVKQMEQRLYEVEGTNKELTERKYKSEATIRELKSKMTVSEEENARAKQDIQTLRKQNSSLDVDYHEQEKNINQLRTRVAVLEQELKDKDQVLAKSSDLLGSEQDKKRKYEDELELKEKEISRLDSKVKAMTDELKKGNEIIKKLQGEIKNYHAKIKLRNQIATEQEKLLGEKDQELEKLRQDLASTKEKLAMKEDESKKLNDNLESTMQKLEESRQLLKTNENVIQWLNKQINETQLTSQRVGTFEMPSATSSFRPSGSAIHNYSTSSYGSGSHHHYESHNPNPPIGIPKPYPNAHRQPQVQYHPGIVNKKSSLPMPVTSRTGPPPPIPEEIRPHSSHSSPGSVNKENDPPLLDPKYLQKREDAIPVRGLMNIGRSNSPTHVIPNSTQPIINSTRLSQQAVVAKTHQPPLASAYFPGQNRS